MPSAQNTFRRRSLGARFVQVAVLGVVSGTVLALGIAVAMGVLTPTFRSLAEAASPVRVSALAVPGSGRRPPTARQKTHLQMLRQQAAELKERNASLLRARRAIGPYVAAVNTGKRDTLSAIADIAAFVKGGGVIFDVKGARVYFETTSPVAKSLDLIDSDYDLAEVLSYLKSRGLYTMARFVAVKDEGLAQADPATQIHNPATRESVGDVWVVPNHPTVLAYNMQVFKDLVAAGIDEVNFDYIRYPTEYALADIGLTAQQKADQLEAFLKAAREIVDAAGGQTKIGISTFAILGWDFGLNVAYLGQDVKRFAPLVDIISPMAYPASFGDDSYYMPGVHPRSRMYYLVHRTLTGYASLLGKDQTHKLRPWIQGYSIDAADLQEQIDAVFDAGACGFTVWNPGNRYAPLKAVLQTWQLPERCPL